MKHTLLLITSLLALPAFSQSDTTWSNVIYSDQDHFYSTSVTAIADKGLVITGHTGDKGLVVVVDSAGTFTAIKQLFPSGMDFQSGYLSDAVTAPDGNALVSGRVKNPTSEVNDALLAKIDTEGDTIWTRTYSGSTDVSIQLEQIILTSDQKYVAAVLDGTDIGLMKVNATGDLEWVKTIQNSGSSMRYVGLCEAADGSFFLTAHSYSSDWSYVFHLDQSGEVIWTKKFDGILLREPTAFSNSLFIQGRSSTEVLLLKMDYAGNTEWLREFNLFLFPDEQEDRPRLIKNSDSTLTMLFGDPFQSTFIVMDTNGMNAMVYNPDIDAVDLLSLDSSWIIIGNGPTYGIKNSDEYDPRIGVMKVDTAMNAENSCFYFYSPTSSTNVTTVGSDETVTTASTTLVRTHYELTYQNAPLTGSEQGCVYRFGSVDELNPHGLEVFPTLTTGMVELRTSSDVPFDFAVFNAAGQQISQSSRKTAFAKLDLSGNEAGIYFYTVSFSDGSLMNGKIVLVK